MEIITWNTYKKKNNPKIMTVADGVFNKPISVEPTLRHEGFDISTIEIEYLIGKFPLDYVKSEIKKLQSVNIKTDLVVYYTWVSRDNWRKFITIGYKQLTKQQ